MDAEKVTLETPERVRLDFELAGVGSRFLAAFIDSLLQALVIVGLAFTAGALGWLSGGVGADTLIFVVVVAASAMLIVIVYYVAFEMAWGGQSPGKRMAGLVVVQDDGAPITFTASAVRNILRIVDMLPVYYTVGIISVLVTSQCKRLGDIAAGTIVVKVREFAPEQIGLEAAPDGDRAPVDGPLLPLVRRAQNHVGSLSAQDIETVERFIDRRHELPAETRAELARRIADGLRPRFPSLEPSQTPDPEVFLHIVDEAISAWRRGAAAPPAGRDSSHP